MRGTMEPICWLTGGLLLAMAVSCAEKVDLELEHDREVLQKVKQDERGRLQLPKLFDFEYYKRVFNKNYGSNPAVEFNRHLLFFSRAVRAFVSGVQYQRGESHSYKSLNAFSDHTERELNSMSNQYLHGGKQPRSQNQEATSKGPDAPPPEFMPNEKENFEDQVREFAEKYPEEPTLKVLLAAMGVGKNRRKKRDTNSTNEEPASKDLLAALKAVKNRRKKRDTNSTGEELERERERPWRQLPQLINVPLKLGERSTKIVRGKIPSNNPYHKPLEMPSFGLLNNQEYVNTITRPFYLDNQEISAQLHASLSLVVDYDPDLLVAMYALEMSKPNEIFLDHRQNCMFEPRFQGACGACYAFATVAVMEWLHCMQTERLVAFSEQYMIDCGRFSDVRQGGLYGCASGSTSGALHFVHNFGMELRAEYPYTGVDTDSCPYEAGYPLEKTGHTRFDIGQAAILPLNHLEYYIRRQPLIIPLCTSNQFHAYGGGVDIGLECNCDPDHSVVIVGHGRQRGFEYWLIRNSFSTAWGEGGYYKLAKTATLKCIAGFALAVGTHYGMVRDLTIQRTNKYPRELRVPR